MKKLLFMASIVFVVGCCLLISWRDNSGNDLAVRVSKSVNFVQWNMALSAYNKEATIAFHQRKPGERSKRFTKADLDKVMNSHTLSNAEKLQELKKTGPQSSPTMDANFKKSVELNREIIKEFPELSALSPEVRKEIFLKAIKIYDKNRNANYLDY